ncbi:calcium-binding protein [Mesorhizobium sp. CGMCC 1.15528]|uniref:Calcium-binding protein n=1 Tax=Mesorhizobium zhangyense TaxID=1776730 RepID=A0A7C9VBG7_9HYPH|nr:calcium-binding protein [Mesorhizobium zhangyense]NGN45344.1 calcium-binding protein [Mesorhizobium zhangyense]
MIILEEETYVSPDFTLDRAGNQISVHMGYYLPGYYDEESGVYSFNGDAHVEIGSYSGSAYQYGDGDPFLFVDFVATLSPGTFYSGSISIFDYDSLSDIFFDFIIATYDISANVTGSTGVDILFGSAYADKFVTDRGDDFLFGYGGNDTLNGGAGADEMFGGAGDDIYYVDNARDVVSELSNEGTDTVRSTISLTLSSIVERLELLGTGHLSGVGNDLDNDIVGNSGNNALWGRAGNDLLNGAAGKDTMYGGLGNDIYVVSSTGDGAIELAGEGTDTIRSHIDWSLGANLERLELQGSANLTGNGNTLNNTLVGNDGKNILRGGTGNDTLNAGKGSDTLVGGAGNDTFVFNKPLGSTNIDKINDYNPAQDTIQLDTKYFVGLAKGWLSAGAFHTGSAAHDSTDRIIYNKATGDLLFDKDGLDGAAAIKFALLSPGLAMTAGDFFLV